MQKTIGLAHSSAMLASMMSAKAGFSSIKQKEIHNTMAAGLASMAQNTLAGKVDLTAMYNKAATQPKAQSLADSFNLLDKDCIAVRQTFDNLTTNKQVKKAFRDIASMRFEGEFGEHKIAYARAYGYDAAVNGVKSKRYVITINNAIKELFEGMDYRMLNNLKKARGEDSSKIMEEDAQQKGWTHLAFKDEVIKLLLYWLGHYSFTLSNEKKLEEKELDEKMDAAVKAVVAGVRKHILKIKA